MRKPIESLLIALTGGVAPAAPLWEARKAFPITALCYDSRLASEGTVFFCLVGKVSDGHEFALTAYAPEDLEFLTLMRNLESFTIVLMDCPRLPDLSGLEKLHYIELIDSTFTDLSGLENSSISLRKMYSA